MTATARRRASRPLQNTAGPLQNATPAEGADPRRTARRRRTASEPIEWFDTCCSRSALARTIVRWDPPTAFSFVTTDRREVAFQLLDKKTFDEAKDRLENPPDLADDDEVQFFYHWAFVKFEEGREPGRAK